MQEVKLIKIFIASPGDVWKQRNEVEKLISDWNNEHVESKNVILMPIRWENNSVASYRENSSGQAIINEQIVKSSDILIALFWSKIGTRTPNGISGTVEEINIFFEMHKKSIGIFFIDDPIPDTALRDREMVLKYKRYLENQQKGLYGKYDLNDIRRFITKEVNELIKNDIKGTGISNDNTMDLLQINIFDDIKFDKGEQLFIIFLTEDSRQEFGARWMAKETITEIKKWEDENSLLDYLSQRYDLVLSKLEERGFLYVKETTDHGNPRLFGMKKEYYQSLKQHVLSNSENVNSIKRSFLKSEKENFSAFDLPF